MESETNNCNQEVTQEYSPEQLATIEEFLGDTSDDDDTNTDDSDSEEDPPAKKCLFGIVVAQGTGRDPKDQWKDMGAFGRLGVDWHGWAAVV